MSRHGMGTAFFKMEALESSLFILHRKTNTTLMSEYKILSYHNVQYSEYRRTNPSSKFYLFIEKIPYPMYYPSTWVYRQKVIKTINVE